MVMVGCLGYNQNNMEGENNKDQFVYRPDTQIQPSVVSSQNTPQSVVNQQTLAQTSLAQPQPNPPASSSSVDVADNPEEVSWTASEFIHYQKSSGWYLGLLGAGVLLTIGSFILLRDKTTPIVILLLIVIVWMYGKKQPRTLNYKISPGGITIENKYYDYGKFRGFSVHQEGNIYSLSLSPMQRFMPQISIYFSEEDGEKIVGSVSQYLPMEDREPDVFERISSRLRF